MNGIHVKTAEGYVRLAGTGVEKSTLDTMPEQYRCPPTQLTGTYQDPESQTKFGFMWDWGKPSAVADRTAAFNQSQLTALGY